MPDAVVGHSMGEVGAAHVAGALDLDQAMQIICRRSALMRRTSGQGAMALVELSLDAARGRIAGREAQLAVAVSNSPRSSVISGDPQAVAEVMSELARDEVFCRLVKVDVASHSPQMEPLAAELAADLAALAPARGRAADPLDRAGASRRRAGNSTPATGRATCANQCDLPTPWRACWATAPTSSSSSARIRCCCRRCGDSAQARGPDGCDDCLRGT